MEGRTNNNIALQLDPVDFIGVDFFEFIIYEFQGGSRQVQTDIVTDGTTQSINVFYTADSYKLRSLRAFIDIVSIAPVSPFQSSLTDDNLSISRKILDNDLQYPKFLFELMLQKGNIKTVVANLHLQNKRPSYYINLMRFLTDTDIFYGSQDCKIVGRIRDYGDGLPQPNDVITIFGEVVETGEYSEAIANSNTQSGGGSFPSALDVSLSGSLSVSGGTGGGSAPNDFRVYIYGDSPYALRVYFVPSGEYSPGNLIDLSSYSIATIDQPSGAIQNLTTYLDANGSGYYFLGSFIPQVGEHFVDGVYVNDSNLTNAEMGTTQAFDPSYNNLVYEGGVHWILVTDTPAQIFVVYQVVI